MRARARVRSACAGSLTRFLAFPRSRPGKFDGTTQKNGVRPTHWTTAADERQWKRRVGVENHFHAPGDDARRRQEEELAASAFAGFDEPTPTFKRGPSFGLASARAAALATARRDERDEPLPPFKRGPSFGLTSARATARPASSRPRSSRAPEEMASLETTLEQERVARLKAEEELILFKRMMRTSRLDEMEEELRQLRQALAEQKKSATARQE